MDKPRCLWCMASTTWDLRLPSHLVQLRVIGKRVKSDTLSVDNVHKVSNIQHEQYWAKDWALWHRADAIKNRWTLSLVTKVPQKCVGGQGSTPDPTGGALALPRPLSRISLRGRGGKGWKRKETREGKGGEWRTVKKWRGGMDGERTRRREGEEHPSHHEILDPPLILNNSSDHSVPCDCWMWSVCCVLLIGISLLKITFSIRHLV